jgi:Tol biopolymer transport system component
VAIWLASAAALGVGICSAAIAAVPDGPRLAFIRSGEPLPGDELLTTDPSGDRWSRLFRIPQATGFFGGLSWSGDGSKLALTTTKPDFDAPPVSYVSTIPAGGGRPKAVRGSRDGGSPVFSPDGRTIAFARLRRGGHWEGARAFAGVSIWLVDADGGRSAQLTPWRRGIGLVPASFSPDGTALAAVRTVPGRSPAIVSISLEDGSQTSLVRNGIDPMHSPNGSTIVFVRPTKTGSDVFVAAADGSAQKQLTFSPNRQEADPTWDPSGERLAFTQLPAKRHWPAREGIGSAIVEVNADGTCKRKLLFTYGISYTDPAWRPGPGRGVGRIEC